jgi:hypothetical protein
MSRSTTGTSLLVVVVVRLRDSCITVSGLFDFGVGWVDERNRQTATAAKTPERFTAVDTALGIARFWRSKKKRIDSFCSQNDNPMT